MQLLTCGMLTVNGSHGKPEVVDSSYVFAAILGHIEEFTQMI